MVGAGARPHLIRRTALGQVVDEVLADVPTLEPSPGSAPAAAAR